MGAPVMPKMLKLLSKMRDRAVDAAIADALPHLDQPTAKATLDLLVTRNHRPSQSALVSTFCELTDPLRSLLVERATDLHDAIRAAIESAEVEPRRGAIELVVASKDVASSHLLADALHNKCSSTRELAAKGLLELTRSCPGPAGEESRENAQYAHAYHAHLAAALSDAVSSWEVHHQRPVLEAALYLGDAVEPALLKKLNDPSARIGHMVAKIIEATTDTRLAGFLLRALAIEPLRNSAVSTITRSTSAPLVDAVLRQTWLLADLRIEQGCRWLKDGEWSRTWCNAITDRSSTLPSTAINFIAHLGGTPEQRTQRFAALLEAPNDSVRRETLWRMIADESEETTALLVNFARRTDEPLAELASRESRRRQPKSEAQSTPAAQPVPTLPTPQATSSPVPATTPGQVLERFLDEFDRLTSTDRKSLGGKIMSLVGNLPERLNKYARSSDVDIRARTIRVAVELGIVGDMPECIYELAHDPDGGVRAVAVSALRYLPGVTSTRILRDAINDPQPRVQANAVETLEALGLTGRCEIVSAKLESPNNRVRANTVKALLGMQFEPAADALLNMLEDESQAHRLSALWVVERMGLQTLLDRMVEMSQSDPDGRVRNRAARVLRNLATASPTDPSRRAVGLVSSRDVSGVSR